MLNTMYPQADIPVVPMSVDVARSAEDHCRLGAALRPLCDEGVMILASGNVVHNLMLTNWDIEGGYDWADDFDQYVNDAINATDFGRVINYREHPAGRKAVPTVDHYWPLLVALGAVQRGDQIACFNNYRELGSMSMTSYIFM